VVDHEDLSPPEMPSDKPQLKPIKSDKETEKESRKTPHGKDNSLVTAETMRDQSNAAPAQIASLQTRLRAAKGRDLADFKAGVIAAIKEASYFPRKAARKRQYGRALVKFRIHRDGSISGISVARSSGHEVLDKAAKKIVRKASKKFPRFPEKLKTDDLSYLVPIVFKKKGG
jgi:protein TonB